MSSTPVTPFAGVPATPSAGIAPAIGDPRIRKRIEQYAQWLLLNNKLAASPQKMQAYQEAALEINKVGEREVRTFAPFQERTSALHVLTSDQFTILAMLAIYWSLGLFFLHLAMLAITLGIITLLYICGFVASGMLATKSFSSSSGETIDEGIIRALDELGVEWPTYTILCPLYKEATIVPQFVEAIKALDYPMDRLQVLFLTEENDNETRAALYNMHLPPSFTILTVPKGTPQTKPRACNFGLLQAKGQFVVIFDAEDKAEPYQLKKAVLTFANLGSEVACVQAKLNYYNTRQNLLTRWFTAEYSTWFDIMLPGLQRTGFSLPLGGTSNHFRTEVLHALGGWDAFNVTEDCDLGLRISHYGLKTAVLDSTTYEEATSRIKTWLLQRSRWIKGYLQTYLVHMRHPIQTLRQGHVRKFCSLQLIVGAWTVVLLLNPFMWALTLLYILLLPVHLYSILFPGPILYLAVFCLIFGNFFYVYIHIIGCLWRQEYALIKWVLLIPFYWVMMSASAYIAFYQLIVKPHHWEKTQHGTHLVRAARAQVHVAPRSSPIYRGRTQWSAYRSFVGVPGLEPEGQAVAASMPTTRIFAVTVGRVFKQVAAPKTLEGTTQRVIALRRTLATQIGQRKVRRQEHLPHTRDLWLVATVIIACITSISACWYYFQQHEVLLYGDSLSHLRIARGVFDSATPGLAQLGGDWLPLPHILMWPFVWNDYLWRTGLAGSFAAMPCYIVSAAYIF
ncbi:MAG TPA: glycosyltransferase, partial [Ktedonobacteraceae bacterium]|nr:glycosyltransferase [Ktedonobacteraceae bacterium]